MPYHAVPCRVTPRHAVPCRAVPYRTVPVFQQPPTLRSYFNIIEFFQGLVEIWV